MKDDVAERVYKMVEQANPITPDDVGRLLAEMTPEERNAYRQLSEIGMLPGDEGGGFTVLYEQESN